MVRSRERAPRWRDLDRGAFEGVIAAMAMSGMRVVSTELGWIRQVPPDAVVSQKAPRALGRLPARYRRVAIELLHWGYGAAGGAMFGALPPRLRDRRWTGVAYGLGMWLAFEMVLDPLLGLERSRDRPVAERLALAVDHGLYGLLLSWGRPGR